MLDSKQLAEDREVRAAGEAGDIPGAFRASRLLLAAVVFAIVAACVVIWGVQSRVTTAAAVKERTLDMAVPSVSVAHPKQGAPRDEVLLPGNIQAFTDSPIYARASGYLKRWDADIGARVKAGQVLAEIDAPDLDQQVQQAKANLQQAQAALEQSLASVEQGRANEGMARVTAQRWKDLQSRGVVSRQENDQYQAQLQAQSANLNALEKAVSAQRGNVASLEANLNRLQELQGYKTVKAPFDGVITARNTDLGALINGGNGAPNQELFHLAAISKLRVFVSVPQAYAAAAVPGLEAEITLTELPSRRFRGVLVRSAGAIDANTRTLLTELDVDNASGELRPGSYAQVHLKLPSGTPSLIVPVNALIFRSEGLQVGVVREGGKVELVPITLGKDFGTEVEVVSGLSPNDLVVVNPSDSLATGTVVRVAK